MTTDVMKYATAASEKLKMNVASDLSIAKEDRLAAPSPSSMEKPPSPIEMLPKDLQSIFDVSFIIILVCLFIYFE